MQIKNNTEVLFCFNKLWMRACYVIKFYLGSGRDKSNPSWITFVILSAMGLVACSREKNEEQNQSHLGYPLPPSCGNSFIPPRFKAGGFGCLLVPTAIKLCNRSGDHWLWVMAKHMFCEVTGIFDWRILISPWVQVDVCARYNEGEWDG